MCECTCGNNHVRFARILAGYLTDDWEVEKPDDIDNSATLTGPANMQLWLRIEGPHPGREYTRLRIGGRFGSEYRYLPDGSDAEQFTVVLRDTDGAAIAAELERDLIPRYRLALNAALAQEWDHAARQHKLMEQLREVLNPTMSDVYATTGRFGIKHQGVVDVSGPDNVLISLRVGAETALEIARAVQKIESIWV
ncbi:hypothetical protein NONI108955_44430 [Nocardia ninae]|uniref:Uncharacterized protein n=1 Tax=Nocardia ninae NBRC 108245 TaxID=1210091 RepID=A0A511MJR4_9NOCA|nr:hypothetical protein [Nocardia ninae]GEM40875.1 hypothetical protein NN4_53940 [Nocardia ninae NBRC 108245]